MFCISSVKQKLIFVNGQAEALLSIKYVFEGSSTFGFSFYMHLDRNQLHDDDDDDDDEFGQSGSLSMLFPVGLV